MRERHLLGRLALALGLIGAGCDRESPSRKSVSADFSVPRDLAPALPTAEIGDGLQLVTLPSGHLLLRGRDQWGKPLQLEFENGDYARKGLAAVSRSLTPAQAKALATALAPTEKR